LAIKNRIRSVKAGVKRSIKIFVNGRDATNLSNRRRQNRVDCRWHHGLRSQDIIAHLSRHGITLSTVFAPHTPTSDSTQHGVARGLNASCTGAGIVKRQTHPTEVQCHHVAVERTKGAAREAGACGCQQAIVSFVRTRNAGRGQQLRRVDLSGHRRDGRLR
jgi:hypothetical protein